MDFFGMGTMEILLILVIALIVMGPGRIVETGRTLGKMVRTLRKASFDLTNQLGKELEPEKKDRSPQSAAEPEDKPKKSSEKAQQTNDSDLTQETNDTLGTK